MSFWDLFRKEKNNGAPAKAEKPCANGMTAQQKLDCAMQQFYANPCEENIQTICAAFIEIVAQNKGSFSVPFAGVSAEGFEPLLFQNPKLGAVYHAYTTVEGDIPNTGFTIVPIRNFFEIIAKNSLAGLLLNYQKTQDAVLFLSRENICKVLYYAYCFDPKNKDVLDEHNKSRDIKLVKVEEGLIYQRVEAAFKEVYANPSKDNWTRICQEMVSAVKFNISFYILGEKSGLRTTFAQRHDPQFGNVYMACTKAEEVMKCGDLVGGTIPVCELFDLVLNGPVDALELDPANGHGVVVVLNKENIRKILEYADSDIEELSPEMREYLLSRRRPRGKAVMEGWQ